MEERNKLNKDLAEQFFRLCNCMSEKELSDALKDALDRQHRTVIQNAMGVLRNVIEHYAREHGSDLRNEDSLKWAKEVSKVDGYFRYI